MALLAEEIVEEWLNRQGYFTIRGVKVDVHEIDLLAVRYSAAGLECRHIEVQASINPMSYLTQVSKAVRIATGRAGANAKRREVQDLLQGVSEWIEKKYDHPRKREVRDRLAPGPWSRELVVHRLKYEVERKMVEEAGIKVWDLSEVIADLKRGGMPLRGAAGAHLVELVVLACD